jgi:hypothetical protein
MATPLIPQEIYILERYSSVAYHSTMVDSWRQMLDVAETALERFMMHLPSDYRKKPLPEQPDIVWGERVLPNFRATMEVLEESLIGHQNGDVREISAGDAVRNDCIGQMRDFPPEWMNEPEQDEFYRWRTLAWHHASNMRATYHASWAKGDLTTRSTDDSRGPFDPPPSWPKYTLDHSVRCKPGEPLKQSGIYLPDCDDSCAQLLIINPAFPEAQDANIGYDETRMQNVSTAPTTWTLIRRVADSGGGMPGAADLAKTGVRIRLAAGEKCTATGFYFTPAQAISRRKFTSGELMPELNSSFGATIWQWDEQQ